MCFFYLNKSLKFKVLIVNVPNYQGGDLSSSVCELELPGCLAIRVIWDRAVKVSYSQSY